MMPRMDGLELCRHFREERPGTEVLIMSGSHHPGKNAQYLAKPFTPTELRDAVHKIIGKKRGHRIAKNE